MSRSTEPGHAGCRRRGAGFTLVEVLVALAVVGLALPALLFALDQQIDGTSYLRDKSLAGMVAANKLTEIRMVTRARQELQRGEDSGVSELAGREWFWRVDSQPTEVDQFFRVEVTVSDAAEEESAEPLARLVAFMLADLRQSETAEITTGPPSGGQDEI